MTSAQIELMAIDVPLVVYNNKKNNEAKHTKKEMNDLLSQWEEKRKRQGKSTDFKNTSKANFNDFMRTGMDAFKDTNIK